jgi:uncharacterized protein YjbK
MEEFEQRKIINPEEFKKINCTFLKYGDIKLSQKRYYCDSCDFN